MSTIIVTEVILLLLCSGAAFAVGYKAEGERDDNHAKVMQYQLDLTNAQVKEGQAIRAAHQKKMKESRKKVMEARKTFRENIGDSTDVAEIREAFTPVAEAMQNAAVQRILVMQELKQILSQDQAARAEELRDLILCRKDTK